MVDEAAGLHERVVYEAYGKGRHRWAGDVDGDGDVDSTDVSIVTTLADAYSRAGTPIDDASYEVDSDLNHDGIIDATDKAIINALPAAAVLAGGISDPDGPDAIAGYDGYLFNRETGQYHVRLRSYDPTTGRWHERDSAGYDDGNSLYQYVASSPSVFVDVYAEKGVIPASSPDIAPSLDSYPWQKCQHDRACENECTSHSKASIRGLLDDPSWAQQSCVEECKRKREQFLEWYESQRDISWTDVLPDCPCRLNESCDPKSGGFANPDPKTWNDPSDDLHGYHEGAKVCMRSKKVGRHANQCCYDEDGELITHGSGSGSSDLEFASVGNYLRAPKKTVIGHAHVCR
jgi:RHS repeat-associated protein